MSKVPLPGLTSNNSSSFSALKFHISDMAAKNPFVTIGDWNDANLKNIKVVIGDVHETTSEFTRKKNPNNRYWKAIVSFKSGNHESRIIKMNGCEVPFNRSANYGSDYIYAKLQKPVCDAIVKAAIEKDIITSGQDKRVSSDGESWWMTINNTAGRIGVVDKEANFDAKDLSTIFQKTQEGVILNLDLVFSLKLTVNGTRDRLPSDIFTITPDCSRGAFKAIRASVEGPTIDGAIPQQPASKNDIASQELIEMIDTLTI